MIVATARETAAIPARFRAAYEAVVGLARHPRYLGAAIFGSVSQGYATDDSDFDVFVAVDADDSCTFINHPVIGSVKLDVTFHRLAQLEVAPYAVSATGQRPPMLAGARIIFDKTGELSALIEGAEAAKPRAFTPRDAMHTQFMMYHGNDKVERHLRTDPATALFAMHVTINNVLEMHYHIRERWWVSSKYLLPDLDRWDAPLAALLRAFVATCEVGQKFALWTAILDHVLAPLGGRQPIAENICPCPTCAGDLAALLDGHAGR